MMVSPYQNVEKWVHNFEDIISLFNLNDLFKFSQKDAWQEKQNR